jgi:hypothetical protein
MCSKFAIRFGWDLRSNLVRVFTSIWLEFHVKFD